jgi:hypothetical protein
MVRRWLRSSPEPPPWDAVRAGLIELGVGLPALDWVVSGPTDLPSVRWTDGPGPGTVTAALGDLPGWTLVEGPPASDLSTGGPVLHLDRTLSDTALAVCLVRFYASRGRHWHTTEGPAHQDAWRALTGADDPGRSGYPIPDEVARLLLAEPDPPELPVGPTRADELSAKLRLIGYERLWAVAFAAVP